MRGSSAPDTEAPASVTPHHPRTAGVSFACWDGWHWRCRYSSPETVECACGCHEALRDPNRYHPGICRVCGRFVSERTHGRTCIPCVVRIAEEGPERESRRELLRHRFGLP